MGTHVTPVTSVLVCTRGGTTARHGRRGGPNTLSAGNLSECVRCSSRYSDDSSHPPATLLLAAGPPTGTDPTRGEPLMLGRRGRHSYGSEQQARGKADARTMLLRPASNHRILPQTEHCSTSRPHETHDQRHSQSHMTPVYPYKVPTTRGDSSAPSDQRGTRGGAHPGVEVASQKLETGPSPM